MLINSNTMTLKNYQRIRILITIILAVSFSQGVIHKNFIIPLVMIIAATLFLMFLRRSVKEILADERDYAIAGKAASWTIQIYSWLATVIMIILYSIRDANLLFEPVAQVLAYSTCFLLLVHSLIFTYLSDRKKFSKKIIFIALVLLILGVTLVLNFIR